MEQIQEAQGPYREQQHLPEKGEKEMEERMQRRSTEGKQCELATTTMAGH